MSIVERALAKQRAALAGNAPAAGQASPPPGTGASTPVEPTAAATEPREQVAAISLDLARLAEAGYQTIGDGASPLGTQIRTLRRAVLDELEQVRAEQRAALIVVTSAVAGEGKSFVSINLALSLAAERSREVVLVDFDAVRPVVTRLFGCAGANGVRQVLGGSATLASVTRPTDYGNLSFIGAGTPGGVDEEPFAGSAVDVLLADARRSGAERTYVFDCPPVLASEDAQYIAKRVDYTVFVVRADQTSQRWTRDALAKFSPEIKCGLLLNGRVGTPLDTQYGYSVAIEGYKNES